jgi:hypothetical protein
MRGGVEAIFDNMNEDHLDQAPGLAHFAPKAAAHGPMYSARRRLGLAGEETAPNPVPEMPEHANELQIRQHQGSLLA